MHKPNHHSARASRVVRLGDPVLDRYLEFVESRARRNTVLATASDLKAFFRVVDKAPGDVTPADVLGFVTEQRKPKGDGRVVRLADGESGLAARTIKRRLSSVSGLFSYLVLCGDVATNPVPRGLATRRQGSRGPALIRTPHIAEDPHARRGQRPHGGPAHPPGPGHGRGHAPRRAPSLRGAGAAVRGPPPR